MISDVFWLTLRGVSHLRSPIEMRLSSHLKQHPDFLLPSLKLTYPLRINGWKMNFPFGMAYLVSGSVALTLSHSIHCHGILGQV